MSGCPDDVSVVVMDASRAPVTTVEELLSLDSDEMVEGYLDGFDGDAAPGNNRSKSYWHGWRNGQSDRNHTSDLDQAQLARVYVEHLRRARATATNQATPPLDTTQASAVATRDNARTTNTNDGEGQ